MKNNFLKDKFPEIFSEIDVEKTKELYPMLDINSLSCGSNRKIWWKCSHGHSYLQKINKRTLEHSGCPYCSYPPKKVLSGYNDLRTWCNKNNHQDILSEWDYAKNYPLRPENVLPGTHTKFWWVCPKGHSYLSALHSRTGIVNSGCPICSSRKIVFGVNDLETWCKTHNRMDVLDDWDYNKNKLTPKEVSPYSNNKYWFKCKHGHEYSMMLSNKTDKMCYCPKCSNHHSTPELTLVDTIKKYSKYSVLPSYKVNNWEFDLFLPELNCLVEYDGLRYHGENIKNREERKNSSVKNYKLIRIKETDNPDNLKKFKEILPSGLIIYYIPHIYNSLYFQKLSEIIKDFLGISVKDTNIRKIFYNIKPTKLSK